MTNQENKTNQTLNILISNESISEKILSSVIKSYPKEVFYNSTFLNSPIILNEQYLENLKRLSKVLNDLFVKIVYNYTRDVSIQNVIQLDRELLEILYMAEGTPYELGMYMPEFMYDSTSQARINQINSCYPTQDWLSSYYTNLIVNDLSKSLKEKWKPVAEKETVISEFSNRFDNDDPIFFIQQSHDSPEVTCLKEELKKLSFEVINISPDELEFVDGQLKAKEKIARQFYLDMTREELKVFDSNILKAIISSGRCVNDVRTNILIHDKRLLAVLFNEEIMASYIDQDDYNFLKPFLVPTFILNNQQDQEFLLKTTDQWHLKECYRDNSILVNGANDDRNWTKINDWQNYIVQPCLVQKSFKSEKDNEEFYIKNTNLFFNAKSFGPGVFRASLTSDQNRMILPYIMK